MENSGNAKEKQVMLMMQMMSLMKRRYQSSLQTSMRRSDFIYDSVQ